MNLSRQVGYDTRKKQSHFLVGRPDCGIVIIIFMFLPITFEPLSHRIQSFPESSGLFASIHSLERQSHNWSPYSSITLLFLAPLCWINSTASQLSVFALMLLFTIRKSIAATS